MPVVQAMVGIDPELIVKVPVYEVWFRFGNARFPITVIAPLPLQVSGFVMIHEPVKSHPVIVIVVVPLILLFRRSVHHTGIVIAHPLNTLAVVIVRVVDTVKVPVIVFVLHNPVSAGIVLLFVFNV